MAAGQEVCAKGRNAEKGDCAHASALFRQASAQRRSRSQKRPGDVGPRGHRDDSDLYARDK